MTADVGSLTDKVLLHEIGHILELSADNYKKYAAFARDYFVKRDGRETVNAWLAQLEQSGMSKEGAQKELVAEFSRQIALGDPRAISALCKSAPRMSMRVFQWLNNTKARMSKTAAAQSRIVVDAQRAFAKGLKSIRSTKAGENASNVSEFAPNRTAMDNALAKLEERMAYTADATESKETEAAGENTQPALGIFTESNKNVKAPTEQTQAETETAETTVEEQTAEEAPTQAEPAEDFSDVVDTDEQPEYNNNAPKELPFKLTPDTRQKIMRVVSDLRLKNADADGKVPKHINDQIGKVVKYQVMHDANYVDTPADVLDAYAERFKAPQNDALKSSDQIREYQKSLMQGNGKGSQIASDAPALESDAEPAFGDIQQGYNAKAQYMTEYQPTEQQLHDPAWYQSDESKEYWAKQPQFAKWAHKNLAWVSAAAWNQVNIPYETLMEIPEIKAAQAAADAMSPSKDVNSWNDHKDDESRKSLQDQWVRWITGQEPINDGGQSPFTYGSAEYYKDENGKTRIRYTGKVDKNKQAFIILGRPAAGKSAVFADPYSNRYNARIIDSDLIKEWTPEFKQNGGIASGYVQLESAILADRAIKRITGYYDTDENGENVWHAGTNENVVIPRVGGPSITELIDRLTKDAGYEVTVLYNDLPQAKSIMRAMSRYAQNDRYLDIRYLHDDLSEGRYDVKCWKAFEAIADMNAKDHNVKYMEWRDNDVNVGQEATERWNSNDGRTLEQAKQDVESEDSSGQSVLAGNAGRTGSNGEPVVSGGSKFRSETNEGARYYTEYDPAQLDDEYMPMAERYLAGESNLNEMFRMREILNTFAGDEKKKPWRNSLGGPQRVYSGQKLGVRDFTPSNSNKNQIYASTNMAVADSYIGDDYDDKGPVVPLAVEMKDQYVLDDRTDDDALLDNARRLLGENYKKPTGVDRAEVAAIAGKYVDVLDTIQDNFDLLDVDTMDLLKEENANLKKYDLSEAYQIDSDIFALSKLLDYSAYRIKDKVTDAFGITSDSSFSDSDISERASQYADLNGRLSAAFAKYPDLFMTGQMKKLRDLVMGGELEHYINVLNDLASDAKQYKRSGMYENTDTGELLTRDELRDRMRKRKQKAVYDLYVFQGENPYETDNEGRSWASMRDQKYQGYKPRIVFDNARKQDNVTSLRVNNLEDWGHGDFYPEVHGTMQGDDIVVPSDEPYYLLKSADLVTLDKDGNIIPPSQRFNLSKNDTAYYHEYDPQTQAVSDTLDGMTEDQKSRAGDPRIIATDHGYVVCRVFNMDGLTTGNPMMNMFDRTKKKEVAMIAPPSEFVNGDVGRTVPVSNCTAIVTPNTDAYAEARADARDAGASVYVYDTSDPTNFDRAIDRAANARHAEYMPSMGYDEWLEKYGAINQRSSRPIPTQTKQNNRVNRVVQTAADSSVTTDETYEQKMPTWMQNGTGTYTPVSNAKTLDKAKGVIERAGSLKQAAADLHHDVAEGNGRATDLLARAELLYAEMQNDGTLSLLEQERIFGDLCMISSDAGRALQLVSELKNMTPEGHISYIEQVGKRMSERHNRRTGQDVNLTLTQEEKDAYHNAVTDEQRKAIDKEVSARWSEETSKLGILDRIRNWRYFAMLGNPRTHFRNMIGNTLMLPITRSKDFINTAYQLADIARGKMSTEDRTTTFFTRADAQTKEWVAERLKAALPVMQGISTKYIEEAVKVAEADGEVSESKLKEIWKKLREDQPSTHITEGKNGFGRFINALSSFNTNALELEDALYLGLRFKSSMYQQIQAKGLNINEITDEQRNNMVNYAMQEALRATFRDASALSDALNKFARTNKATELAMEAIVPFKKTPINIAKRSIEYSPLGLVQGAYKMLSNNAQYQKEIDRINSRNYTEETKQAELKKAEDAYKAERIAAIDRLAEGTTGSILYGLGLFAASMGWISIGKKDDEESQFEQSLGKNNYSLNIGNVSIDLSAFSPAAVPLLMGTATWNAIGGEHEDGEPIVSGLISALAESVDPITEMSMLSGIADALSGSSYSNYSDGKNTRWFGTIAGNALESYVGQFVPTFVGQTARAFDPYARSYSAGNDYWASKIFGSEMGGAIKNLQNKVGLGWLSDPKVDLHGENQSNYTNFGSWLLNVANNWVLPATIKVDRKNDVDNELVRLYGVVDTADIFPTKPSRNIGSYTDKTTGKTVNLKLDNDAEYAQYQREVGQTTYDLLEELMQSMAYRQMSDTEKAQAVEKVVDTAKSVTKKRWKAQMMASGK